MGSRFSESPGGEADDECGDEPSEDVPRPLQIVKRPETTRRRHGSSPRSYSAGTDESLGSAPEPVGADRPLTVPKRRGHGSSDAPPSAPVGTYYDEFGQRYQVLQGKGALHRTGTRSPSDSESDECTPRPRRSSSYTSTRPPLQDETRSPGLSNKASLHMLRRREALDRDSISDLSLSTPLERPQAPPLSHSPLPRTKSTRPVTPQVRYRGLSPVQSAASVLRTPYVREAEAVLPYSPYRSPTPLDSFIAAGHDPSPPDPYLLVPRIVIMPETKVLDDSVVTFWAAVQASTQLGRPCVPDHIWQRTHLPTNPTQSDVFQYGCLYDVKLDVGPTPNSAVIEVLDDRPSSTLYPGSRILKLAHVRLLSNALPRRQGHLRQNSDELIEDLEYQLGDTVTEFLRVRMTYRHSGFPQQGAESTTNGVVHVQTTMETSVTGVVKRHNSSSPWSPRPAPQQNPLFEIIASHWGPAAANDVMYRILTSRSTPRKAAKHRVTADLAAGGSEETLKPAPSRGPPAVPKRQTSLRAVGGESPSYAARRTWAPETAPDDHDEASEREMDPARKIWTEMRRTSTGSRPSYHVSHVQRVPSASARRQQERSATVGPGPELDTSPETSQAQRAEIERQREAIRERALRNRRSVGADTLRSLVPTPSQMMRADERDDGDARWQAAAMGARAWAEPERRAPAPAAVMADPESGGSLGYRGSNGSSRGRNKRESGRWGWGGWWQ